jgi:hypothetical protein
MEQHGKTAAETGKILFDAVLTRMDEPQSRISPAALLTTEQLVERRKRRADKSQEPRYAEGYVWEFVPGNGNDFAYSKVFGQGLTRTMMLAEGHAKCNHCFKHGRSTEYQNPGEDS